MLLWFLNSVLLGAGLAMDAFTVSLANGLHEPKMRRGKQLKIAGVFAGFQTLMPLLGWICVHTVVQLFSAFEKMIPWIALILLCVIGGKMMFGGIKARCHPEIEENAQTVGAGALLVQGIATSIDALSVGFTIAEDPWYKAGAAALLIGAVTFGICFAGVRLGRRAGMKLADHAAIVGGLLLIGIGIEIFVTH